MRRRCLFWSLALLLCLSLALLAATGQRAKVETIPNRVVQPPAKALAAFTMVKHNGTAASYSSDCQAGMGTYTYFDPAVQCVGASADILQGIYRGEPSALYVESSSARDNFALWYISQKFSLSKMVISTDLSRFDRYLR